MQFWSSPLVPTLLALGMLFLVGHTLHRWIPAPAALLGGVIGLVLGPGALGYLPMDIGALETGVYHALAVVFIAIGLQRPAGRAGAGARSMAFGISTIIALQTAIGLGLALLIGAHVGFGLLLPLAFEQGPGQAMSVGSAWEQAGLVDGGQIGLIMAAIGFGWAIVVGVPLVLAGRRWSWAAQRAWVPTQNASLAAGAERPMSVQLGLIAIIYAATWAACTGLSSALAAMPDIAAMVWGFHFLLGAILASLARWALDRVGLGGALDDAQLSRVSSTTVDGATIAALSAVQLAVLGAWWIPIVLISTVGGLSTLVACVWLARRGFSEAPFEHAVLWFGMSTGTLPVGLALLRTVDPELRSPAPTSAVLGSGLAILGAAPVVLGLHPLAISGHAPLALVLCVSWLILLIAGWWAFGGLRLSAAAPA